MADDSERRSNVESRERACPPARKRGEDRETGPAGVAGRSPERWVPWWPRGPSSPSSRPCGTGSSTGTTSACSWKTRTIGGSWAMRMRGAWTSHLLGEYMPVTWTSYALDRALWDLDAGGYHLTSLGLHVAATLHVALAWRSSGWLEVSASAGGAGRSRRRSPPGLRHPSAPGGAGGVVERAGHGARRASPGPGHAGLPGGLGARPGQGRVRRSGWPWWRASSSRPCSPGRPVSSSRPCWCSSMSIPCAISPVAGRGGRGGEARTGRSRGARDTMGFLARGDPDRELLAGRVRPARGQCLEPLQRRLLRVEDPVAVGSGAHLRDAVAGDLPGSTMALAAATVAAHHHRRARRPTTLACGPGGLDRYAVLLAPVSAWFPSGASSAWSTATAMPRALAGPSRPGGRSPSRGKGGAVVDCRAGAPR